MLLCTRWTSIVRQRKIEFEVKQKEVQVVDGVVVMTILPERVQQLVFESAQAEKSGGSAATHGLGCLIEARRFQHE